MMITIKGTCLFVVLFSSLSTASLAQETFQLRLANQALTLTHDTVSYTSRYYSIRYPGGDVPPHVGVCTDVVIRAYRKLGIDLQKLVHEDMKAHFNEYPNRWGMKKTDTNIDHRRVPNLMKFFSRFGTTVPCSKNSADYKAGDIVAWDLGGGVLHIGIVSAIANSEKTCLQIIHNIGNGQQLSDCLFRYAVIGHYRYGN